MRIFLTGATGVIGRRALPALIARGHRVAALARSPASAKDIAAMAATPIQADLFDPVGLRQALAGRDAVINLATHMPKLDWHAMLPGAWSENDRIRKIGSANLADAASDCGARIFIQESFAPVYPDRGDAWIDETVPIAPVRYNRSVADAEHAAASFTERGGSGIVLRFGNFYGPDAEQVAASIRFVRRGWAPLPGRADDFISLVSHDDAAAAVVAALDCPPGIYNVIDDEPMRRGDFYGLLAQALHVAAPRIPPRWLAGLTGSVGRLLARSQRISNRKLRATGWAPRYSSVREGWPATLREMGF